MKQGVSACHSAKLVVVSLSALDEAKSKFLDGWMIQGVHWMKQGVLQSDLKGCSDVQQKYVSQQSYSCIHSVCVHRMKQRMNA